MKPSLSLVIPCYNEEKYIGKLLDAVIIQSVQPDEVIIADSNSTDQTITVAQSYSDRLNIKIAKTMTRTPGAARNSGAKQASSDYILFLDADCIPVGKNYLRRLQNYLSVHKTDFVTCMFTSDGWHPLSYLFFWEINFQLLTGAGFRGNVPIIGGMMCVKRSVFNQTGGFNNHALLGEDTEYGKQLSEENASYKSLPWLYVVHSNRRGRKDGNLRMILYCTPTDTQYGRWIHKRLSRRDGASKRYGHF